MNKLKLISYITALMNDCKNVSGYNITMTEAQIEEVLKLVTACQPPAPVVGKCNLKPLFNAMINNKKIDAIKEHRMLTGFGLKESKDEVDRVMNLIPKNT